MPNVETMIALVSQCTTSAVSDVLMKRGIRGFMRQAVRPLDPASVMFGPACTIERVPVSQCGAREALPGSAMVEAIETAAPGTVFVFNGDAEHEAALWGGLMATAAHMRRASGIVADGPVRDPQEIRALAQPCFCTGSVPQGQKGILATVAINEPLHCAGVHVRPGDFVFGDCNGVVVIPRGIETEVLTEAAQVEKADQDAAKALLAGTRLQEVMASLGRV